MTSCEFRPLPWRQVQKVLREMGHFEDACQVGIAFEEERRKKGQVGQAPKYWSTSKALFYRKLCEFLHWLFGVLVSYGYRPLKLVAWMCVVWLFCAGCYWYAALQGVFGPTNPLVFQNEDTAVCAPDYIDQQIAHGLTASHKGDKIIRGAGNWYLCEKVPEEYTAFSPLVYSLDVLLPLVDLQQEKDWAPLTPTPKERPLQELFYNWGLKQGIRILLWAEVLFGWVASLLLVAVVSGLAKRNED